MTTPWPGAFAAWLFDLLGARPGDAFADLYPGSGGIARAWTEFEARSRKIVKPNLDTST